MIVFNLYFSLHKPSPTTQRIMLLYWKSYLDYFRYYFRYLDLDYFRYYSYFYEGTPLFGVG